MWTKNFKTLQLLAMPGSSSSPYGAGSAISSSAPAKIPLTNINGTPIYTKIIPSIISYQPALQVGAISQSGWHIGSGTTAATENDYTLEQPLLTGYTTSYTIAQIYNAIDNQYVARATFLVTASTAISVSEIGIVSNISASTTDGGTSQTNQFILLYRDTFPTVTLSPSDTLAITCDLVYPLPS